MRIEVQRWAATIAAAVLIAIVLVTAAGSVALRGGISARPGPSAAEAALARHIRHLLVPASARALQNPLPLTDHVLARARAHFADHCASCHGNDGKGNAQIGRALYPRSPDLTAAATQSLSDGELFYIIENGVRFTGMPGWGAAGRPEESWELVHFIRHLPRVKDRELSEMEQMNPRSPAEWKELQEEQEFLGGAGGSTTSPPTHQH
jgi:mono/diheme cytochrome c family protein